MATRSINLKLVLNRGTEGKALRQNLWTTHAIINKAVAELEQVLLLCRGRGYWTGEDEAVSAEKVQRKALAFARKIQKANGKPNAGTDAEVLAALQGFYEALVPSVLTDENGNPREGDAQAAGGFAGPLMDAKSEGFLSIFEKILDPPPAWIAKMEKGEKGWEMESKKWLESEESQRLQYASGSPPSWVRRLRNGQPWQEAFVKDQEKKRAEIHGVPSLIRRMKRDLGLLPLVRPPITSQFADKSEGLTPWDRLALRLAVAHLLSWESWNHRATQEHGKVKAGYDRQQAKVAEYGKLIDKLRTYETHRHKMLKKVALADDARPYRIGARAIRAWDRLRQAWQGRAGKNRQTRLAAVAQLQTKLGGRFGDPELFRWLADDGRETLWREVDPLPELVKLNAIGRLLERKKDHATWTPPDAQWHPRWTCYEAPKGSNLRNYRLQFDDQGLRLRLPLLSTAQKGLSEVECEIPLAPSGQMGTPVWNDEKHTLGFRSAHQAFSAELGGGEILLARRHLENRKPEELEAGLIGPVWFKLVLDVEPQAPEGWLDGRGRIVTPPAVHHFNTGLAKKSKHEDLLEPGLRILSVDLGVRTFATCSVFELVKGRPKQGLTFLADRAKDLWARHERSFFLSLPGESPDSATETARAAADDEMALLRRDLRRLKDLLRLSIQEEADERRAALEELRNSLEEERSRGGEPTLALSAVDALAKAADAPAVVWKTQVEAAHRKAEKRLGTRVRDWRRKTRPRAEDLEDRKKRRSYRGGKSVWIVQYLDNVRRFLAGWSLHGRQFGEIRRADREKRGVFAARLLAHLNAIKNDRVKAGSDLIVQAARGYLPEKPKGWGKRYEPCRLILFEDLARYRFRLDRPRRENSQLMRWNHRQVVAETEMQAGLYGIGVETTGAGFSSRFHARSGAPGCRMRRLSERDFLSPPILSQIQFLEEDLGLSAGQLRPGMRVPWPGGEEFATLDRAGHLVAIHADVNAAQNLQRRFWTRHADAYRISCLGREQGGKATWYPEHDGVRLRGALGLLMGGDGYARLVAAPDGDGFVLEKATKQAWRRATGAQATTADDEGLEEVDATLAEVVGDDEEVGQGLGREVFFRDPSGLVLRQDRWYAGKEYWARVVRRVAKAAGLQRLPPAVS